ncbi:hypothetical protein B277_04819 [Janibacter hoylei PVAS-1]|uniref:Glycosyltransferase n=1 Tax=Janibacter hoylei PVAS-1 TaxID=1210046 RepID=K1ERY2_9MICO|nr:hypothetical protein [Janibacter hoylei]EKA61958.1 hypothetical protein B277_04819 [Janibacter hoylei PVAS-1]RWU84481.1 hypothetical protein CWN80_04865 [Janibacter hoylei PVAS-1]
MHIDPSRAGRAKAIMKAALIARYRLVNLMSRRRVLGDCPMDVSVTSYGDRLGIVAYVIESLAAGSVRPRRMILWVDDPAFETSDYPMLERLVARGLEIKRCTDYGPHKKYYPYCADPREGDGPLVTADDDVFYPRDWLATLWSAHLATPDLLLGHRAISINVEADVIQPYATWGRATTTQPDHRTFVTGVGGVVYPPALIGHLRSHGEEFLEIAPRADDVWINSIAARHGIRTRWTGDRLTAWSFPRSQDNALHHENATGGGNDPQVARAYVGRALAAVQDDARS